MKSGVALNPSSPLATRLRDDFGGFERWKKQFMEIGKFRGVGWVVLNHDPLLNRLQNFWVTDHELGHIAGFTPILVMDVWEHAYIADYGSSSGGGSGREDYLKTYFDNIDWDVVSERLEIAVGQRSRR